MKEEVIAAGAVLSTVTTVVGLVVVINRWSGHTAKTESSVEKVESAVAKMDKSVEHILSSLARHVEDKSVHANEKFEDMKYRTVQDSLEDMKAGMKDISKRLEELKN